MKPTFWFAAPGLAILWLAALTVMLRLRSVRVVAQTAAIVGLVVAVGGLHFLRNAWTQGFLISPGLPEYGQSAPTSVREYFDVTFFNVLASTTTLLTPEIIVRGDARDTVVDTFRSVQEGMGIYLPNARVFTYADRSWDQVFYHFRLPYDSDKAGFGAIIPLIIAPAVVLVVADALRRRTPLTIPSYLLLYSFLYLISLSLTLRYAAENVRYLIEMVIPLLVLVPLLFARLPLPVGMLYLAVACGFMVSDAYLAYRGNELRPPARVMVVPRAEQYPTFVAPDRFAYYEGARLLNRKYPVEQWPEIFLFKEQMRAVLFEYPFLDPQARRRLTYWSANLEQNRPAWPGPLLLLDPRSAEVLQQRFADQIVLDRLSDSVWLGLPLDRLRVVWQFTPSGGVDPSIVQIRAMVDSGRYARPQYRFSTVYSKDGSLAGVIRGFSDDAGLTLSAAALSSAQDILVETRDRGSNRVVERVRVSQTSMLER